MKIREAIALVKNEDQAKSREWAKQNLSDAAHLPISFVLDGGPVRGIPAAWQPTAVTRRVDANLVETVFAGRDPKSGLHLRVECTAYQDYPVVEWVAWFTNQGEQPTSILSDILGLDGSFAGSSPVVYTNNGDFYSAEGYTPVETPLGTGETVALAPNGGRPCDGAFPYTRIRFAEGGVTLAIGWPAQWAATFEGTSEGVQVRAGQEKTHLRLHPGESIRTPSITALFWDGDESRAINLWRRWYLAHVQPHPNGQPIPPVISTGGVGDGEEHTAATEENQLRYIDTFRSLGINFDVWWIDAGWYPCYNAEGVRKWTITGTWEPDAERFPNGLKPISDRAAEGGGNLLLWFEPERVRPGTKLDQEHPEWLLHAKGNENGMLYLGNPEARQWLTDHVNQLIQENGIKIYRQDFNFAPLAFWRENDAEDRQGINENLHVQGYLQYWDDLLAANPGLWIDSCSSGGRRNDLETMRRSVPLHMTDYGYGDHPVKLAFQHTLFGWLPYFKSTTLAWDLGGKDRFDHRIDRYSYHCAMAAMISVKADIRRYEDYDFEIAREMLAIWRRASDLFFGDYYPLTPFSNQDNVWNVRQFDDPKSGRGFVQGIRFPAAPQESFTAFPQSLNACATYRFENGETGEAKEIAGATLIQEGLTFTLPQRSGAIWFYQRLD